MADSDNESGGQNNSNAAGNSEFSSPREQDRFLPIANVSRIMKKALPANAKISKDAKETVQECVSEFISFITGEASDKCQREKRKTINGDDLLWAMTTLGFEEYVEPLKLYLQRFREMEGDKSGGAAGSSSTSQPQHKDGGNGGAGSGGGGGGFPAGAAGGMYPVAGAAGGGMVMMGQHMYGTSPSSGPYHHHQMGMGGGGGGGAGGGGGGGGGRGTFPGGGSSSPGGLGRQGRV